MATTALGNKAVGSTIKLNVNGTAKEFNDAVKPYIVSTHPLHKEQSG